MIAIDIIKTGLAAVEAGYPDQFGKILADDMVFSGATSEPLGKREFLGLQTAMVAAMPDWKFNATDFKQNGDKVTAIFQITGTQTRELILPMPGFSKIPPTGKQVSLSLQPMTFTLKEGKITRVESEPDAGYGVMAILAQLGVALPHMA
jgi:predicted ester cyclase